MTAYDGFISRYRAMQFAEKMKMCVFVSMCVLVSLCYSLCTQSDMDYGKFLARSMKDRTYRSLWGKTTYIVNSPSGSSKGQGLNRSKKCESLCTFCTKLKDRIKDIFYTIRSSKTYLVMIIVTTYVLSFLIVLGMFVHVMNTRHILALRECNKYILSGAMTCYTENNMRFELLKIMGYNIIDYSNTVGEDLLRPVCSETAGVYTENPNGWIMSAMHNVTDIFLKQVVSPVFRYVDKNCTLASTSIPSRQEIRDFAVLLNAGVRNEVSCAAAIAMGVLDPKTYSDFISEEEIASAQMCWAYNATSG
ncbi:hypothetical protein NEAUS06_1062 [Nematocida ausubeli]|nr:hypothetical protein NEAUS06_1062 [Nematocida ausubeli]